ncbi:hypothetical protein FKM82_021830 [Ascaphus truei]
MWRSLSEPHLPPPSSACRGAARGAHVPTTEHMAHPSRPMGNAASEHGQHSDQVIPRMPSTWHFPVCTTTLVIFPTCLRWGQFTARLDFSSRR